MSRRPASRLLRVSLRDRWLAWPIGCAAQQRRKPFPQPSPAAPRRHGAQAPPTAGAPARAAPRRAAPAADGVPTAGDAGRRHLSDRAVHHVVRRRPRPAVLPLRRRQRRSQKSSTFYRTTLKQKGEVLFESPPTHQFETGRFRDETMAFPPSVTIKDYTWGGSAGYPNPKNGDGTGTLPDDHSDRPGAAGHAAGSVRRPQGLRYSERIQSLRL